MLWCDIASTNSYEVLMKEIKCDKGCSTKMSIQYIFKNSLRYDAVVKYKCINLYEVLMKEIVIEAKFY